MRPVPAEDSGVGVKLVRAGSAHRPILIIADQPGGIRVDRDRDMPQWAGAGRARRPPHDDRADGREGRWHAAAPGESAYRHVLPVSRGKVDWGQAPYVSEIAIDHIDTLPVHATVACDIPIQVPLEEGQERHWCLLVALT